MNRELENLIIEESWTVAKGKRKDKPLLARINLGLKPLVGDSRYPHWFGIAIQLKSPNKDGFPSPEESSQLAEIEDMIANALQKDNQSLFAAVLTANGIREFVFYTSDPEAAKARLAVVAAEIDTYEKIGRAVKPDADWTIYRRFI